MKNPNIPPLIARAQKQGSILGLDTVKLLLSALDNPQDNLPVIHIAGTNGKGSIASFLQGMLLENNYQVGLFTSPYFKDPREMFQHNGSLISQKDFENTLDIVARGVEKIMEKGGPHPTEFEIYVALAFYYFAHSSIDFFILEVGLGGREDATNVVNTPLLSIITQVGRDHTQFLGNTLEEIAHHKGGIIKKGCPVVVYPQKKEVHTVLKAISADFNSPYYTFDPNQVVVHNSSLQGQCFSVDFSSPEDPSSIQSLKTLGSSLHNSFSQVSLSLLGKHQVYNAATALLALSVLGARTSLPLSSEKISKGLLKTRWPGRLETLNHSPLILIDGAHNVPAVQCLRETIETHCSHYSITLLLGILEDKDVDGFLSEIMPLVDRVVLTKPLNPRALDPIILKEKIRGYPLDILVEPSIPKACLKALSATEPKDMILALGSLYMIGEAREFFINHVHKEK